LCYWTTFDASAEWFAKSAGTILLFTLLSPFYAGVTYAALTKMLLPLNAFYTCLFVYGAFFLDTTGPEGCTAPLIPGISLFLPQVGVGVGFTIWNVLALDGDYSISRTFSSGSGTQTFCMAIALLYAVFFGVTLMIAPSFFWGPDSMFGYFETMDDAGQFFGRGFGAEMFIFMLAPLYAGLPYERLAMAMLPMNLFLLPYLAKAAFFADGFGPGANALLPVNLWIPQVFIGIFFLGWNIKVLKELPAGYGML